MNLIDNFVAEYKTNPDDETFAQRAVDAIRKKYTEMKTKRKKIDTSGLSSAKTQIGLLKKRLLELGNYNALYKKDFDMLWREFPENRYDLKEFDNLRLSEKAMRLRTLRKEAVTGFQKALSKMHVVPEQIQKLNLSEDDTNQVVMLQTQRQKEMAKTPLNVDGDALIKKLLPMLFSYKKKELIPALLLATGRRVTEVLKTAKLTIDYGMTGDGYQTLFSGQLKSMVLEPKAYRIPLLAPYWLVVEALGRLRKLLPDTAELTPEQVHNRYEPSVTMYCAKYAGTKPHTLRSIYAVMCQKAFNESLGPTKRSGYMNYISDILGHVNVSTAAHYDRIILTNFSGPYRPPMATHTPMEETKKEDASANGVRLAGEEVKEEAKAPEPKKTGEIDTKGLKYSTVPEYKRMLVVLDMMKRKLMITPSTMKREGKGSFLLNSKYVEKNKEVIDKYNKDLVA